MIGEYGPSLAGHTEVLWLEDTPIAVLKRRPGSSDGGPGGGGTATAWSGMAAGGVDVYFVHPDHLDTPRVLVNALNQPVWRWDSAPFGDTAANENPTVGLPSFTLNLRSPGQQYDRETGTHYNYFRDYEPGSGRYVQSDPIGLLDGPNTFVYVRSDPSRITDTFGLGRKGSGKGKQGCGVCGSKTGRSCTCQLNVLKKFNQNELLFAPDKRGQAPYGLDGKPIELHHVDQSSDDIVEMTREEHREGENFARNHTNTGQDESKIEERRWNRLRKRAFCADFDSGRFKGLPTKPDGE